MLGQMYGFVTIVKRELLSYGTHVTAYAVVVVFLLLSTVLAFSFGGFLEARLAELTVSFFYFHPLLHMWLVPAVGMRLWSEEQRMNTIELLGTFPIGSFTAIFGKFVAAAVVWMLALVLTFPMVLTVDYLGNPDYWTIAAGYLGSYMVIITFLAITMLVSALSGDQVVTLVVSVLLCSGLVLVGYQPVADVLYKGLAESSADRVMGLSVYPKFEEVSRGVLRLPVLIYFLGVTGVALWGTGLVIRSKRA